MGNSGSFKKGQVPWNKGKTGYMGANKTSFKKGHLPPNTREMYSYYDFEDIEFIYNTGYKDMDGNYIYTGDILEYKDTGERYLRKYVVEKDEDTEYYYYLTIEERYFIDRVHDMEDEYLVIGNIYENKELIEE